MREWNEIDITIDEIIRSRRRSISLEVTPEARLIIRAPLHMPKSVIEKAVNSKASWIEEKRRQAAIRSKKYPLKNYEDGEIFWYLGNGYRLEYAKGIKQPEISGGSLLIPEKSRNDPAKTLAAWYRARALNVIAGRVDLYAGLYSLKYKSVGITSAKKRWGSCGADNSLNFTWRLVMAPLEAIDYVVVHELAHTCFHDHSSLFWSKVSQIMPDYPVYKQWLAENSGLLRAD